VSLAESVDAHSHFTNQPGPSEDSSGSVVLSSRQPKLLRPDRNRDIYYRHKLEFSIESGWLAINIPFVFDCFVGSPYTTWPMWYTLAPNLATFRWHVDDIKGPPVLRGNWELTASGSYTAVARGPETRYTAFDLGFRRNFVPRNLPIAGYFDGRVGVGDIDAKGPLGVLYAQGQDLTFNLLMGSGVRFNFNPRLGVSAGVTYMHVSNLYLSEPKYENFGINVYGEMFGVYARFGRPKPVVVQ
jgi:hypothetical protein